MSNILQNIVEEVDKLLSHATEIKTAVDNAAAAPNVEGVFVDAVIAALQAMGYTVTAPVQATNIEVTDGNATEQTTTEEVAPNA